MGLIGVLTGLVACLIDVCVIQTTKLKFKYIKDCILNLFNYWRLFTSSRHIYFYIVLNKNLLFN
jgi:hypothetical protein